MDRVTFEIKSQLADATLSYSIARPNLSSEEVSKKVLAIYLAIFDQAVLTATIRKVAEEAGLSADELIALVREE